MHTNLSAGPQYHGCDITTKPIPAPKTPTPRYEHPFKLPAGDQRHGNPQLEFHGMAAFDVDGTAVVIRTVTVKSVVMYGGDDYSTPYDVPFTPDDLAFEARWIKDALNGDDDWSDAAWEAADAAETVRRTGDDY